ncbi:MAG TPA: RHS repeat-associated core domain-containing protein, partial [Candidatus Polarisedimenticolia bacterium]|nr:RHS repeat-associated core domain-containing protein [Candidatus Polarisedimenticolia bacterium]
RGLSDPTFTYPERAVDPLGRVTDRRFDPRDGSLLEVTDPNGRTVAFEYDLFGRRTAEWAPGDSRERPTVAYRHDFDQVPGRVLRWARETSGVGERAGTSGMIESAAYFDGLGRLVEVGVEADEGRVITRAVTYDAMQRVVIESEPFKVDTGLAFVPRDTAPFARSFDYDALGRLTTASGPRTETVTESHAGWTTTRLDPAGHRREVTRDAFGAVVRVRDFEGVGAAAVPRPPALYGYDTAGRLVTVTDPEGGATRISWDTLGRKVGLDDAHVGGWSYRHDLAGNLIEETDPQGRVTRMTHDALGRPLTRTFADGARIAWSYDEGGAAADAIGRVTSIADASGTQSFTYDARGRVTAWTRRIDGVTWSLLTDYDALGRITSRTFPADRRFDFSYDDGGQIARILPGIQQVSHDPRGRIQTMTYDRGVVVDRQWDPATGLPTSLAATRRNQEKALDLRYGFDADGLLASVEDDTDLAAIVTDTYAYDGRHRLVHTSGPGGAHDYAYDDAGTAVRRDGVPLERDDPFRRQRITRAGAGGFLTYDALGATTSIHDGGGDRLMTYDAAGRLTRLEWSDGRLRVDTTYDASGLPVREVTDRASGRSVLVTPFPGVEVRDGRITVNVQLGDLRVLTQEPDDTFHIPVVDHLGTARLALDREGNTVAAARFGPYGEAAGNPPSPEGWLRYGGARVQDGSGLVVMGWRHYDPTLGRFLEPDPMVGSPLDTQALNRYAYARDNPVNLNDPDGRNPLVAVLFIGAIALLDRDTRADVAQSVGLTAASIFLTGLLGPGFGAGLQALAHSTPALYASAATTVILDSRLGQGIVDAYASLLQEAGLSPRAAATGGNLAAGWLLNSHLQRAAASALAPHGPLQAGTPLGDRTALDGGLSNLGIDPATLRTPSGDAYGTTI